MASFISWGNQFYTIIRTQLDGKKEWQSNIEDAFKLKKGHIKKQVKNFL